jgi:hypothetical protein
MVFKVTHVINCNTFEVYPPWKRDEQSGIRVKAAGYTPPEEREYDFKGILDRLVKLISGKEVSLENFREIDYDCLVCDVIIEGKNLVDYFFEYRD